MKLTETQKDGIYVAAIEGRIDTEGATEMDNILQAATRAGQHKMVLNMAAVKYISSNGLRTLADVLTQNKEAGGDLKLVALNAKVLRVLQIVGFDRFFSFYDTVDDAIAAFSVEEA